jgi:hypothetical protein
MVKLKLVFIRYVSSELIQAINKTLRSEIYIRKNLCSYGKNLLLFTIGPKNPNAIFSIEVTNYLTNSLTAEPEGSIPQTPKSATEHSPEPVSSMSRQSNLFLRDPS